MWVGFSSHAVVAQAGGPVRSPTNVFNDIYTVFLILGTLVGVVVIGYTMYNALKYRSREDGEDAAEAESTKKVVRPTLGSLPQGSGGGKKLFVSFGISAVIVIGLIIWTYSALLYVEDGPSDEEALEIDVVGQQFNWLFIYPNGEESTTLRVPKDRPVKLNVTSADVFHNIGIPAFNAKADAIPGQTTSTWFVPEKTGTFEAVCYELCGSGHSIMRSDVIVMTQDNYESWYANSTDQGTKAAVAGGGEGS